MSLTRALSSFSSVVARKRRKLLYTPIPLPSAEEAVNNILYNSPPVSAQPITRHVLNCLVANEPGVLSRLSGVLAARGFNIDSLIVAKTQLADLSRMTVVLNGPANVVDQCRRQLEDLVPVWAVLDYTHTQRVEREMVLVKVWTVPEEVRSFWGDGEPIENDTLPEADVAGSPSISQSTPSPSSSHNPHTHNPLAATSMQRSHLIQLSKLFNAHVLDVSLETMIIELTAKPDRIDAFLKLVKPFGVLEVARSGAMAMPRSPMDMFEENDEVVEEEGNGVDATMLPPG